jgi:lambda family phage holin
VLDELEAFFAAHPWLGGGVMAVLLSTLRVVYDKEETSFTRIMLEAMICGALSVAAGSALDAMGYGQNWYLFCGGVIGFMGSQSIRAFANRFIAKRIPD